MRSNVQVKGKDVNQPLKENPCQNNVNVKRQGYCNSVLELTAVDSHKQKNQALDINQPTLPRKESNVFPAGVSAFLSQPSSQVWLAPYQVRYGERKKY